MGEFALADGFDAQVVPVGTAGEPVAVIDGVMRDWQALRDFAATQDFRDVGKTGGFPGLRAALPAPYVRALLRRLDPLITELFFAGRKVKLEQFDCNFSLVSYAPEMLHPQQKLPHVDIANGNRIALLHYLCPDNFGGTAFYRQISTGLEQVDRENREHWLAERANELAQLGPGDGYPDDGTAGYSRIASFAARPNRLLAYRSHNLHSGIIDHPELLSDDPLSGRLTANFFLDYREIA